MRIQHISVSKQSRRVKRQRKVFLLSYCCVRTVSKCKRAKLHKRFTFCTFFSIFPVSLIVHFTLKVNVNSIVTNLSLILVIHIENIKFNRVSFSV